MTVNLGMRIPHRRNYAGVTTGVLGSAISTHGMALGPAVPGFGPARRGSNDRVMTVVKINAITVREGSGDELGRRFASRAGAVDDADGFEGFELMQPNDDRSTWLVITRWRDEDSFNAWVSSPAFAHGHRGPSEREDATPQGHGDTDRSQAPGTDSPPPVGVHSELWSYVVVDLPSPQ